MNFLNQIQKIFVNIFSYLFRLLSFAVRRLRFVGKDIPVEDKVSDFIEIFKSTRLFFVFNLLALFVFIALPQGKDVILITIEDLSNFHFGSLISLLVGLIGWSVISEFGARYKIYVTDNSGRSLSDERVNYRKEAQKFVSTFYLLLPTLIVMLSVITVSFNTIKSWHWPYIWPFVLVVVLLILTFAGLSRFYLDDEYIDKLRNKKAWFKVSAKELKWVNKLYGIYTDHVLMVRKEGNFKDKEEQQDRELKNTYKRFTDILESLPPKKDIIESNSIETFPRDYIIDDELAPTEFKEVEYRPYNFQAVFNKAENKFENKPNPNAYYRWIYKNNPAFFRTLHLQVHVIAISSLIILLIISTKFLISYEVIGSPGLVCLSFGCWLGLYTGLLYLDSRYRKKVHISIRWLLLFWFFIVSYINNDHPVRTNKDAGFSNTRPSLSEHFSEWIKFHKSLDKNEISWVKDTAKIIADSAKSISDSTKSKEDSLYYPVFFITAEGGALRTGAFTAMLLARLQDTFPAFKNNIYAFSTVSGGSVGISFFNAISFI
ncbi:MAG: hypothetical protein ABJA79_11730, partial [Parafilimonas sp.]